MASFANVIRTRQSRATLTVLEAKVNASWLKAEVMCFLETGHDHATQLVFDYEHPPRPPRPSLYYHMEKQLFNRAYWYIVPQGHV